MQQGQQGGQRPLWMVPADELEEPPNYSWQAAASSRQVMPRRNHPSPPERNAFSAAPNALQVWDRPWTPPSGASAQHSQMLEQCNAAFGFSEKMHEPLDALRALQVTDQQLAAVTRATAEVATCSAALLSSPLSGGTPFDGSTTAVSEQAAVRGQMQTLLRSQLEMTERLSAQLIQQEKAQNEINQVISHVKSWVLTAQAEAQQQHLQSQQQLQQQQQQPPSQAS